MLIKLMFQKTIFIVIILAIIYALFLAWEGLDYNMAALLGYISAMMILCYPVFGVK